MLILLGSSLSFSAWAYPEFIGFGYSSCVTCHYNGHGNGPLNDYGRAVWASEIAGRAFVGNKSDEELGKESGFFFKERTAWWIKPGIKARGINIWANPKGSNPSNRSVLMQFDANAVLLFDKKEEFIFVTSLGYVPNPRRLGQSGAKASTVISREHYVRWHASKEMFIYAGFMDKVYGLRIVDHTAYSRLATGLAQNDQSHGVILQYIQNDWEASANIFLGNGFQDLEVRQDGSSGMFEYNMDQNWRLGASFLSSSNRYLRNERLAVHSRSGYSNGNAVLWELGMVRDIPLNDAASKSGYYMYSEMMQKLSRGYHLFIVGQAYKGEMATSDPDNLKMSAGLLMFPMPRTELRFEIENARKISESTVTQDNINFLSQLHISL